MNAYVREVGQKLATVADRPLPYEFVVLNSSVPNAWAMPGGRAGGEPGPFDELNNEAELAAVLGARNHPCRRAPQRAANAAARCCCRRV